MCCPSTSKWPIYNTLSAVWSFQLWCQWLYSLQWLDKQQLDDIIQYFQWKQQVFWFFIYLFLSFYLTSCFRCTNQAVTWQQIRTSRVHHPTLTASSSWSSDASSHHRVNHDHHHHEPQQQPSFASLTLRADSKGRFGCRSVSSSLSGGTRCCHNLTWLVCRIISFVLRI